MGPSYKRKTSRKSSMCNNDNKVKKREEGTAAKITEPTSPPTATTPGSPAKIGGEGGMVFEGCCTTPKAEKNRIPEIKTCPPAPKKRRILSNFSLKRSPISFFAPPDLEHFFFVPRRNVSV